MKKTILVTTSTFERKNLTSYFEEKDTNIVYNPYGRKLLAEELENLIAEYKPLGIIAGTETYTKEILENQSSIKVISRCGVGLDNIDLLAASLSGITIVNTPSAPIHAVKELTIGLVFNALRNISLNDSEIKKEVWSKKCGRLLKDQTVGVIGYGRIGSEVANFFTEYGCKVLVFDQELQDCKNFSSLEYLLSNSNIVTLHVPSTPQTRNMINKNSLLLMKSDVIIVNTSRGDVICEEDLYSFLKLNEFAHASMDTFKLEPYYGELCSLPNVTLTSHIGSFTTSTREQMEQESALNLYNELERFKNAGDEYET